MKKLAVLVFSVIILFSLYFLWQSSLNSISKQQVLPDEVSADDLERTAADVSPIQREEKIPTHHSEIDRTK